MSKIVDLQPMLDYFEMLQTYEKKGLLQMALEKHEVYLTRASLCTLANADTIVGKMEQLRAYDDVMRRLRTYAAWRSTQGKAYAEQAFAIHVVKDSEPYDLVCTVLLTRRRRWWALWREVDDFEVIDYTNSHE